MNSYELDTIDLDLDEYVINMFLPFPCPSH